jgi:transposase
MDVIHARCAGIDCSKKDAKVCVRIHGQGRRAKSATVTTWGATTGQILALREHLVAAKVTCVVIESTSNYWKPFYYRSTAPTLVAMEGDDRELAQQVWAETGRLVT